VDHASREALEAGLETILNPPRDKGSLELIVSRPKTDERETLEEGHLDLVEGLVGDDWRRRGSPPTPDGSAHPDKQITLMNARVVQPGLVRVGDEVRRLQRPATDSEPKP